MLLIFKYASPAKLEKVLEKGEDKLSIPNKILGLGKLQKFQGTGGLSVLLNT